MILASQFRHVSSFIHEDLITVFFELTKVLRPHYLILGIKIVDEFYVRQTIYDRKNFLKSFQKKLFKNEKILIIS